ncbi:hypothetical protein F2Q68_00035804 [Brassica cretica]|uniref:Uncharacterized protein n=1 Tax=Brassica cretica TaxID=69181 RepID=A0A8S9HA40_BRACR|nr:hypothetical protein F2Q68_00035804 [Brassica cretica]
MFPIPGVAARGTLPPTKINQLAAGALRSYSLSKTHPLDARKSRRISTNDTDPKERPNAELRDKLNAGACDLRIRLNRSKSTDLRRRLEQSKKSSNDTPS